MATPARTREGKLLLDAEAIERTLSRIAHEIIERNPDLERVALIGIHTRGVPLARRLRRLIAERSDTEPALGATAITFHPTNVLVRGSAAPLRARPPGPAPQLASAPA